MVAELQERFQPYVLLLDGFLFIYALFAYEWGKSLALLSSIAKIPLLVAVATPLYYVKLVAILIAPFVLAVLFYGCLGATIFISRFYEGRWQQRFKFTCLLGLLVPLGWLLYEWGVTVWHLPQYFPSELPRGLQDLLISALFSDCGGRIRTSDTALPIGPSIGMQLFDWLIAIYLAEKYLRFAMFHERQGEHGIANWVRFMPLLPGLLIAGFVSWGLWGDIQRQRMIDQVATRMQVAVIEPRATPYWHTAVEHCAFHGEKWRLPTIRELLILTRGDLGKDVRLGGAWSGETDEEGGPQGLRWKGERQSRPTYMSDVTHRCLSAHPSDLYQRLIVTVFPEIYSSNHGDKFYRYFYPHERFSVYDGLSGGRPEAVLCVKPDPLETTPSTHQNVNAVTEVKSVTNMRMAVSGLEKLCDANQYDPTYCHRSLVHKYTEIDRLGEEDLQDVLGIEQRFNSRLEECRSTSDTLTCLGHGGIYEARGEFARTRRFYEEACRKASVPDTSCVHVLQLDEREIAFVKIGEELTHAGIVDKKPERHREAYNPLQRACQAGKGASCGYLASIYSLQNRLVQAKQYYERGCTLGDLFACTNHALLQSEKQTDEQLTGMLVDICHKGEPFACNTVTSWKLSKKEPDVAQAIELASRACIVGSRLGCANEAAMRQPGYSSIKQEELEPYVVRPSTPHDIKNFRSECVRYSRNCEGYLNQLALQGQFKEAEWFKERLCIEQHLYSEELKECTERVPWKGLFESVTDALMAKKYIRERPVDHASLLPSLKQACQDGIGHACWYLGNLMYYAMTGRGAGHQPIYSKAGLLRPLQKACELGVVPGCQDAANIARQYDEGQFAVRLRGSGLE